MSTSRKKSVLQRVAAAALRVAAAALIGSAFFPAAHSAIGPPERMPDRTVRAEVNLSAGQRDIILEGRSGGTFLSTSNLRLEQDALLGRLSYAISNDFLVRGSIGLSRLKLGNPFFGALGALNMQGDYGQSFGIGGEYTIPAIAFAPDVNLAVSADWKNYKSAIPGGNIEGDGFEFAIKAAKEMGEFLPYAGILYAPFEANFKGITNNSVGTSGTITENAKIGIFGGVAFRISDRLSARLEGEHISQSAISLGLAYDLVGYWSTGAAPAAPPPMSPEERASAVPPASRPDPGILVESAPRVDRTDVRRANQEVERGNSLLSAGRSLEAIRAYEMALELDPGNYRARYNLATLQYRERNYSESRRLYSELLGISPNDVDVNLYLGFSHYRMGDMESAARSWRRVLEIDPSNSVALNNLQALRR